MRSNDGDGARRFRRHFGGHAAKQIAQQGILSRADNDVVDMVGAGEFEDRVGRIDRFENMGAEAIRPEP